MTSGRLLVALTAATIVIGFVVWRILSPEERQASTSAASQAADDGLTGSPAVTLKPPPATVSVDLSGEDREFIDRLREKFGAKLARDKHLQIRVIDQIVDYLMKHYPDDWQERVYAFLKQLFPEMADQLYERFQRLQGFNEWMRVNRSALAKMPPADRRNALWAARREAFGEDAAEIWAGELRGEKIRDSLAVINSVEGKTTDEKFSMFLSAVNEAYGEEAPAFIESRQTELINSFVGAGSVQADLAALPPEQQHAELRKIRSGLGMGEEALNRWSQLDTQRDTAWNAGQQYMAEREKIVAQYQGEEQQAQLQQLQEQSFGDDAETIRNEEAAGFYRFGNKRRIGRE